MIARCYFLGLLLTFICTAFSSAQTANSDLIPKPNKIRIQEGVLDLNEVRPLYMHEGFEAIVPLLKNIPEIQISTSEVVKRSSRRQRRQGIRILYPLESDKLSEQSHKIVINENGILIKAHTPEYMIPAIQTLHQLRLLQGSDNPSLPFAIIEDQPRFVYRGLHLDVSRHFMPLDFIKKYIDLMALYKFNHLHWQLANGGGWRLESRQYPELTEKTAWRSHTSFREWTQNGKQYLKKGHPNAYGGYYTKEQAREVVQYAAERGITVIPEVGMAAAELMTALPQLSRADPEALTVIKNILDEILEVFPSAYIHIGGSKTEKNKEEQQDDTILQICEYLQSKGRKIMAWDNVSENTLSKNVTLMIRNEEQEGIKAANAGHDIILSFPRLQDIHDPDPRMRGSVFDGYISPARTYAYDPMPQSIQTEKAKHNLGIQGNLWTTNLQFPQQIEYTAFPNALALAEVGWTMPAHRNVEDFEKRLQSHYPILQQKHVYYTPPSFHVRYEVLFEPEKRSNKVILASEQYEATIRYTTDGSDPVATSTLYHFPVELSGTTTLKAASFIDTTLVSPIETVQLDVHKAIGKRVKYNSPWSKSYPAQKGKTLTNGEKGSPDYIDGQWQGFTQDLDIVIDLDRREEINSVSANFLQIPKADIFFPEEFKVFVSENGRTYREIGLISNVDDTEDPLKPKNFRVTPEKPVMARYVKVVAGNKGKGILLVDEVVLY